jgi:CRISPR/Cas system-associated exonuclease Cas4 (RecB family)
MDNFEEKSDEIKNEFSWSKSRDNIFLSCHRRYYYNYYAYWGGWDPMARQAKRELWVMRYLSARPLLLGNDVHETIAWIIRRLKYYSSPVSPEDAKHKLLKDMLSDWLSSMKHDYLTYPKQTPGLQESYYLQDMSYGDFEKDYSHAEICISDLYETQVYSALTLDPSLRILQIEQLDLTEVANIKVWVISDLILGHKSGCIEIVDWKTGKDTNGDAIEIQLGVYALYAVDKLKVPVERITVREVNVYTGKETPYPATPELLKKAEAYIIDSAGKMTSLLSDPTDNKPLGWRAFSTTENTIKCKSCNFRGICKNIPHITSDNQTESIYAQYFEQEYRRASATPYGKYLGS